MAKDRYSLRGSLTQWPSQTIAYAFLVELALVAYLEGALPDLLSILVGFSAVVGVSYLIGTKLGTENLFGTIGAGTIAYAAYSIILEFTKLSTSVYIIQEEAIISISFGLLAGLVYLIQGHFK